MARQRLRKLKPKLPELYRQCLERKTYAVEVEITIEADSNESNARTIGHPLNGTIRVDLFDEEGNDLELVKIGSVLGWRTCSNSIDEILPWADRMSQGVYDAFAWLSQTPKVMSDDALLTPALFIESVEIKPMWRGQGLTLPAVATFLDLACCQFVFAMPGALNTSGLSLDDRVEMQGQLQRYWQKLGFQHYDAQSNAIWTPHWSSPAWLRGKLNEQFL